MSKKAPTFREERMSDESIVRVKNPVYIIHNHTLDFLVKRGKIEAFLVDLLAGSKKS